MENIVRLGLDVYYNRVQTEFTNGKDAETELRNKLIELNGGSDKIDPRYDNKLLFRVVTRAINQVVEEGLSGNEFWNDRVEYINMKDGDLNEFEVEGGSELFVAEMARGIGTPRRQRIGEKSTVAVPVKTFGIRIYEELDRLLAGRVSWNTFVDKVAQAVMKARYEKIYTAFSGINKATNLLSDTYVIAGSYDEEKLITLAEHVEAATGKPARIIGTKSALRKISTADVSDEAKSDLYNIGHYGRLKGIEMTSVRNLHRAGTTEFMLPDNKVWVVAADDQFIKFVNEGDPIIIEKSSMENSDLSQEYTYIERYGCMVVLSSVLGMYTFE